MGASKSKKSRRPAATPEGRDNQLISLAYDLAERQMISGTAPAQIVTHFLKLGTVREKLEQEKLQRENLLLSAKVDQIASAKRMEELFSEAIKAMRQYTGSDTGDDFDEDVYDELQ